ncbi:MAG TPA: hypothetical protein VGH74_15895, partial [Planctomycetaceae bacterium]
MLATFLELGGSLYLVSLAGASLAICLAALAAESLLRWRSSPLRHDLLLTAVCLAAFSPLLVAVVSWSDLAAWHVGIAAQPGESKLAAAEENRPQSMTLRSERARVAPELPVRDVDGPVGAVPIVSQVDHLPAVDRQSAFTSLAGIS